jgi:acetylornithine deacetylase/succinyl-diaminopimelate desuccinylase-like protein
MGFTWEKEALTELPAGSIPNSAGTRIVQAALAIGQALGSKSRLMMGGAGMSWAIAKGIPSVTLGATTRGFIHSPNEWAGIEPIYAGIKQYILLMLMLTELE